MGDVGRWGAAGGAGAWDFLAEGFAEAPRPSTTPSWNGCHEIANAFDTLARSRRKRLFEDLDVAALDRELASLGGDPLRQDWRTFRPLVLGHEEGWSDWLAHVIATGDAEFLRGLFKLAVPVAPPDVRREQVLPDPMGGLQGNYRSDLILEWAGLSIHVEVKIGDPHLEKTWAEAARLRSVHGGEWHHFLLVLPEQRTAADQCKLVNESAARALPTVTVITWEDVERELRHALRRRTTPGSWRGVARAFTGALGQIQLRRPVLGESEGGDDGR